jgi:hypothetical protein
MRTITICTAFVLLLASCGNKNDNGEKDPKDSASKTTRLPNSREGIVAKITELEKRAKVPGQTAPDRTLSQQLIAAYNEYVMYYPADSSSQEYAFQAAAVAINTYSNDQALVLIDNYLKNYQNKERKLELLLLKGMIYDDRLNADDRAKLVYEQIIREYPGTPAADQAAAAMKLLGKSDMELIKEFEKKNNVK